jgi:hypothetical protein
MVASGSIAFAKQQAMAFILPGDTEKQGGKTQEESEFCGRRTINLNGIETRLQLN